MRHSNGRTIVHFDVNKDGQTHDAYEGYNAAGHTTGSEMQYPKLYATNNHELSVIKWNWEAIALYVDTAIVSSILARKTPEWSFCQLI